MDKISISWNTLKRYSGLWVAIAGEEILASGRALEEVMKKVEASGKQAEVFQVPLDVVSTKIVQYRVIQE